MLDGEPNTDLIPPPLIVARYLAAEQIAIETLEAERDAISRQMEELDEEHGGEEGLLAEANWICSTGFSVVRCNEGVAHPAYVFFHMFWGRRLPADRSPPDRLQLSCNQQQGGAVGWCA